jgi:hypothetical protein
MKPPWPDPDPHRPRLTLTQRAGLAAVAAGFLLFLSTFVSFAWNFGDFDHFESHARSMMLRAIGGMALIIGGAFTATMATQARVLSSALSNRDLHDPTLDARLPSPGPDTPIGPAPVKVRCHNCQSLNDQADAFCPRCGAAM